ncbi:MAG: threonine synthase, partial [Clostridiales bacterium]|nr:threonine synthase [Clostridiales bacterium]
MLYISTRDSKAVYVSGAEAIARGLAPDGGLYVPQCFPPYAPDQAAEKDYAQLAEDIFALYLGDFSRAELSRAARAAYTGGAFPPAVAPCVQVGPFTVLELFHGPTCAFKDMALSVLPHLLNLSAAKTDQAGDIVILVATSGDTGK